VGPLAIIQARTGSTRLPGKVLMPLGERSVLERVIRRCQQSRQLAGAMVATSDLRGDDAVVRLAHDLGVSVFRGSESDVLDRYVGAATHAGADVVVRITADCPLIDPEVIDRVLARFAAERLDYCWAEGYPNGLGDVEAVRSEALARAAAATTPSETFYREHVTTYIREHPEVFALAVELAPEKERRPFFRLSVDEAADLEVVRRVSEFFHPRLDFRCTDIIAFLDAHPEIAAINRHVRQKTV
jgi:spore coat polysaccharide biosynthesis protein SpsF (cytidylyltransferase family)